MVISTSKDAASAQKLGCVTKYLSGIRCFSEKRQQNSDPISLPKPQAAMNEVRSNLDSHPHQSSNTRHEKRDNKLTKASGQGQRDQLDSGESPFDRLAICV